MLRIRFGKLAIAVLAVSGAAAHAELGAGESNFLAKLKGFTLGLEGVVPFVHENKALVPAFKMPYVKSNLFGGSLEIPTSLKLGPVKVGVKAGVENFAADGLYNHKAALELHTKKTAAVPLPESEDEEKPSKNAAKAETIKVRGAKEVNGALASLAVRLTYDLSESFYLHSTFGGGFVHLFSPDRYLAAVGSVGAGYKLNSLVSFEGAFKHVYSFDKNVVNPLTGFAVGVKITY